MAISIKSGWVIPAALLALAFIPVVAGGVRLTLLAAGGPVTPENVRFVSAPIPVIVHIIGATLYAVLGAFQFAAGFRRQHPGWHRAAGRVLVVAGLAAALSGLWMTLFYAIAPADDWLLRSFRLMAATGMAAALVLGYFAIRRRDVGTHQDWMRRAYAIGLGAGTQALTQLPALLLFGPPDHLRLALMMGAAWGINLAVAEGLIWRRRKRGLPLHRVQSRALHQPAAGPPPP